MTGGTRELVIVHVTKYGKFRPGIMGPITGFQHRAQGRGSGICRVCKRVVIRGSGRWWERPDTARSVAYLGARAGRNLPAQQSPRQAELAGSTVTPPVDTSGET